MGSVSDADHLHCFSCGNLFLYDCTVLPVNGICHSCRQFAACFVSFYDRLRRQRSFCQTPSPYAQKKNNRYPCAFCILRIVYDKHSFAACHHPSVDFRGKRCFLTANGRIRNAEEEKINFILCISKQKNTFSSVWHYQIYTGRRKSHAGKK